MSSLITDTDIDEFSNAVLVDLENARNKILRKQIAPLLGKTMMIERNLIDPINGIRSRHNIRATIIGAEWSHEDTVYFNVSYVNPVTGKTVEGKEKA